MDDPMNDQTPRRIPPLAAPAGAYDAMLTTVQHRRRRKGAVAGGALALLAVTAGAGTAALGGGSGSSAGPEVLAVATPTADPTATASAPVEAVPSPVATPSTTPVDAPTSAAPRPTPTTAPSTGPSDAPRATPAPSLPPEPPAPCTPQSARVVDADGAPLADVYVRGAGSAPLNGSFGNDISTTVAAGTFTMPAGTTALNLSYQGDRNVVSRWVDLAHPACDDGDARNAQRTDYTLINGAVLQGTITVEPCLSVTMPAEAYWVHYQGDGLWAPRIVFTRVDAHTFTFRGVGIPPTPHQGSWESAQFVVEGTDNALLRYFTGEDLPPLVNGTYTVDQDLTRADLVSNDETPAKVPASCTSPTASPTPAP